jgi:hypothetical protein
MNENIQHILNKYNISYQIIYETKSIPLSYLSALGIGDILTSIIL